MDLQLKVAGHIQIITDKYLHVVQVVQIDHILDLFKYMLHIHKLSQFDFAVIFNIFSSITSYCAAYASK